MTKQIDEYGHPQPREQMWTVSPLPTGVPPFHGTAGPAAPPTRGVGPNPLEAHAPDGGYLLPAGKPAHWTT